ncbi:MAG: hypothetical protein IPI55_03680 [Flavobacteriales bacterium]|nr:hypothetical protein [Flavobacteriales bacterium]
MKKILITAVCLSLLAVNCKDDENPVEEHTHVDGNTVVSAQFNWKWGLDTFDGTQTYTTALNEKIKIERVQFYLAQPYFSDDNDVLVEEFPAKYLLVDLADGALVQNIGEVNGHLHTMDFILGLDSVTNHSDPALVAADHPLSISNNMHWSWSQGYIFLKVEGKFDSDGDDIVEGTDDPFTYHCAGSDALRRNAEVDVHHDALTGGAYIITMNVDLAALIGSIAIQAEPSAQGAGPVNVQLMNNLRNAISTP